MTSRHAASCIGLVLAFAAYGCDEPTKGGTASASSSAASAPSAAPSSPPPVTSVDVPAPAPAFGADERAQVIEAAAREVAARYVDVDLGAKMADAVRGKASSGGYDKVAEGDLGSALTQDLQAVSHDRRVTVESDAAHPAKEDERVALREGRSRPAGGFGVGGRLPGNVARVVIDTLEPVEDARKAVEDTFTEAAAADAMLLDLRDNTGGDPATAALVASYLLEGPRVRLDDTWFRSTGTTEATWTTTDTPGRKFGVRKPVIVLTSARTTGAGEELAYDLQALHRATVCGEKTAGAARPVALQKLPLGFTLRVPIGRLTNAITKKNWEGSGVVPDEPSAASAALHTCYVKALRAVIASPGVSEGTRKGLKTALKALGEN